MSAATAPFRPPRIPTTAAAAMVPPSSRVKPAAMSETNTASLRMGRAVVNAVLPVKNIQPYTAAATAAPVNMHSIAPPRTPERRSWTPAVSL